MDDLHVDDQLAAAVVDDHDTDTASAISKCSINALEQVVLVSNRQTLLDITGLSYGDNPADLADVQDTVLLEDRSQHGLDNHGWGWVADEGGLFVQLAGEKVNTKIAVLSGLRRHADTDDLRRTALEKENVTNADEVALNRHATAAETWFNEADLLNGGREGSWTGGLSSIGDNYILTASIMVMVGERVQHTVGSSLHTAAEAVILAFVVVVTHVSFDWLIDLDFFLLDSDFGLGWTAAFVFDVVGWIDASTVITLSYV